MTHNTLAIRDIGKLLASAFAPLVGETPQSFVDLLDRLESLERRPTPVRGTLSDHEFRVELERNIPELRSFALNLTRERDAADDLVQEAMLKAWAARDRFQAGTSIRAWTYTILRNLWYTERRRDKFRGEWDDVTASRLSVTQASQEHALHLADLVEALGQLTSTQREALMLVGVGDMSYDEAAAIMGVAVGTVKSRISRAREALTAAIEDRSGKAVSADTK